MDSVLTPYEQLKLKKDLAIRQLNIDPFERVKRIREIREKVRKEFEELKERVANRGM